MQAVTIETERRPVEDAAFGDGGMEQTRGRGLLGGGFITPLKAVPVSSAPATKMIPVVGGNIEPSPLIAGPPTVLVNGSPIEGHVYMTIGGQHFQTGGSGLTPAEPGTTGWVIEQKLLHQMIAQGFLPATVKTIADLPFGTRMTKYEEPGTEHLTYEVVLPAGGTFRAQFSQVALQMMNSERRR